MINFDCKKCIHFPVCKYKEVAASAINIHNKRNKEDEVLKQKLECIYFRSSAVLIKWRMEKYE